MASIHSKNLDKKELTIRRRKTDKKPLTINTKKFNGDDKIIERKKRAYSTHRKIGHTLKINNIHNDNKDINIKANKNKLKIFSSHQINKIISKENIKPDKDILTFKKRNNNKGLTSFILKSKKLNIHSPPKKKPTIRFENNKNNSFSNGEKTATNQNLIFSNNIYIKVNNRERNKYKT